MGRRFRAPPAPEVRRPPRSKRMAPPPQGNRLTDTAEGAAMARPVLAPRASEIVKGEPYVIAGSGCEGADRGATAVCGLPTRRGAATSGASRQARGAPSGGGGQSSTSMALHQQGLRCRREPRRSSRAIRMSAGPQCAASTCQGSLTKRAGRNLSQGAVVRAHAQAGGAPAACGGPDVARAASFWEGGAEDGEAARRRVLGGRCMRMQAKGTLAAASHGADGPMRLRAEDSGHRCEGAGMHVLGARGDGIKSACGDLPPGHVSSERCRGCKSHPTNALACRRLARRVSLRRTSARPSLAPKLWPGTPVPHHLRTSAGRLKFSPDFGYRPDTWPRLRRLARRCVASASARARAPHKASRARQPSSRPAT